MPFKPTPPPPKLPWRKQSKKKVGKVILGGLGAQPTNYYSGAKGKQTKL